MITLVLGGARSGKSAVAEGLVAADEAVTYLATGAPPDPAADAAWAARVEAHRARRPPWWRTVEVEATGDLPALLATTSGTVLVDSLGTWVASAPGFEVDHGPLLRTLAARRSDDGRTVLVSEEVGLGVHPETAVGVAFRDALGELNTAVAAVADEVLLVVAGRTLTL